MGILAKIYNEKWFDIFEKEFDERFETVGDFVKWYNDERLSEATDYLAPNEAYKTALKSRQNVT